MTSLADDLLKSRSVSVLRSLVTSLENDADSKKTELQHMVGSKYHDFIQSADKITSMKDKSSEVDKKIALFNTVTEDLVEKINDLLVHSLPQEKSSKSKLSDSRNIFDGESVIYSWVRQSCPLLVRSLIINYL